MNKREADLLEEALAALRNHANVEADVQLRSDREKPVVILQTRERTHTFVLTVQERVDKRSIGVLLQELGAIAKPGEPPLVISPRISKEVGALLRNEHLCYLDASGNAYLAADGLFIFIQGQKPSRVAQRSRQIRAFREAGLRLLLALLYEPDLLNRTYRIIAERAGISLGAVNYVFSDLEQMGFLVQLGQGRRRLKNTKVLFRKWVTGYAETLRPKLRRGTYRPVEASWYRTWKQLEFDPDQTVWGGEPAVDLLTGHLKPETFTLYTRERTREVLWQAKLVPDPEGSIEILEMCWEPEVAEQRTHLPVAPALVIYADLIASSDSRNLEAARILYDAHLQHLQ